MSATPHISRRSKKYSDSDMKDRLIQHSPLTAGGNHQRCFLQYELLPSDRLLSFCPLASGKQAECSFQYGDVPDWLVTGRSHFLLNFIERNFDCSI